MGNGYHRGKDFFRQACSRNENAQGNFVDKGKIISLLSFLLVFYLVSSCSNGKAEDKKKYYAEKNIQKKANDSIPVLLCGTYFSNIKNLQSDSLKLLLEQGKVYCSPEIEKLLVQKLKLKKNPLVLSEGKKEFDNSDFLMLCSIDSVDHRLLVISVDSVNFFKNPENYPLWVSSTQTNFNFNKEISSYTHTGVTAITRSTGRVLDKITVEDYIKNVKPYFEKRDIVHISNEVSISDTCNYNTMKMRFATKPRDFEIIKLLNANVIELTGNHNLDYGKAPYLNSLDWYRKNNMNYFGGGGDESEAEKPLVKLLKDGKKAAWIGFNQNCPCNECTDNSVFKIGANHYESAKAQKIITRLKNEEKVDYIIACVQFGERDSYEPFEAQSKISKELILFGADVVVGSQAHQCQTIEIFNGKLIFYGLGNFLFDQIHREGVRQAFFLECYFYKGKIIQFQPVYTFMPLSRIPNLASPEEEKKIKSSILIKANFKSKP